MLAGGLALIATSGWLQLARNLPLLHLTPIYLLGLLLLYSSIYSFTADQSLVVSGADGSIRFHKKNLYGRVDWERPGHEFRTLRVFRPLAANHRPGKNWSILLECPDGLNLFLGKNEFGFASREEAVALATRLGQLAGIDTAKMQT